MNDYYNEYKIDSNNISKNVNLKIDNFGNKSIINVLNYQYKGIEYNYNNCFLNSLLQILFYIDEFRDSILIINTDTNNTINNLKDIFSDLKNSAKNYINPNCFIKYYNSNIINKYQQNDIHELLLDLFNKLENELNIINYENIINKYFKFTQITIYNLNCNDKIIKNDFELSIELEITCNLNIYNALDNLYYKRYNGR